MRWILAILVMLLGAAAQGQTVRVTTGDHDGFTRLVLEAPGLTGWRLSRLPDGYSLTLRRPVDFDLAQAFRVITRARLAALAPRPDGTGLDLTLGCACHAIGFDYRPGVVVIDLRDGPPPDGSSFELAADGSPSGPLQPASPPVRPRPRPQGEWDWTTAAMDKAQGVPNLPGPEALAVQQALLGQFADGAARGLIDPVARPPVAPKAPESAIDNARIGLAVLPGLAGLTPQEPRPPLAPDGAACPAADRIDVPAWGDPNLPPAAQLASMNGFLGEFDRPDPDALTAAIRRHLWLGFGVEATALIDAFGADAPDAALWRSIAKAVDGQADPKGAFAGMGSCDSAAALWSAALDDRLSPVDIAIPALLAAFSALPPHLRDTLGPSLAERFVAAGDRATAQALKDAMARGNPGSGILVDAQLALGRNDPGEAETQARAGLAQGGPGAAAAMALIVEARFQARKPLTADDVTALEAMHQELPDDPDLARAVVLSNALTGNFDAAFSGLALVPDPVARATAADIWTLLAETGPESALIQHAAVLETVSQAIPRETRQTLAKRLTGLGFGAAAKAWIGTDGDPVLLAAADLADGDARAALTRSAGLSGTEAEAVRAQALLALGQPAGAADLLAKRGGETADLTLSARIQARDWAYLRDAGPSDWQAAARELAPSPQSGGPLTDGRAVLTQSAATRAAIDQLLAAFPEPSAEP